VIQGGYHLRTNGREYRIRKDDLIYYHQSELVEWLENERQVVFLSVGFIAPDLMPLPMDRRVFPSSVRIRKNFLALYAASLLSNPMERAMKTHAKLLSVLEQIGGFSHRIGHEDSLWQQAEDWLRQHRKFHATLDELTESIPCGRATIVRACRRSTGISPQHRLRQIRMEESLGLLRFSTLSVTQVAHHLGYS